ncbi:hypothetical protein EPUS_05943 [Endocarpon pusillum Z07020]|uniref:Uncharacterized protein n=1 Tax=Endocarpon pusillum (strain Z07020 / HMAS-L-300199) TaxID=1263415 RepID=U1GBH6_ENDPU|nr:uncharacterized protein EPUS_05943 [Endocarpon pusillum Z07020]ERF69398.1 hypothetical protein EPUS_05943 [Endocarpon pusillum Z07020]
MSQSLSPHSSNTTTFKLTAALLIGTLSTTLGLRSLFWPTKYADQFGLRSYGFAHPIHQQCALNPGSSSSPIQQVSSHGESRHGHEAGEARLNPFMLACGLRNVSFGLTQFVFAYQRDWRALGVIWMCGVVAALGDGLLVWRLGGEGSGREGLSGKLKEEEAREGKEMEEPEEDDLGRTKVGGKWEADRKGQWAKVLGHWIPGTLIGVGGALLVAGY